VRPNAAELSSGPCGRARGAAGNAPSALLAPRISDDDAPVRKRVTRRQRRSGGNFRASVGTPASGSRSAPRSDGSPETRRVFLADTWYRVTWSFFFGFELRRFPAFDARARAEAALSSWRSVRGVIHVRRNPSRWCVAFASLSPNPRARSPRPHARRFRRTSRARGSSSLGFTRSRNAIPTPEPARRDDDERPRDASSTASRSPNATPWTSWRSRGVGARSRRVARVARVASGKTPTR
jgi:hypothetical protein